MLSLLIPQLVMESKKSIYFVIDEYPYLTEREFDGQLKGTGIVTPLWIDGFLERKP